MIQGDFQHIIRPETIGSFCDHSGFVVEPLDTAQVDIAFGLEPVEQEWPVSPQHLRHFFHRFEPGAHGSGAPLVEEDTGPAKMDIVPEALEVLLEQVGPDGFKVAVQQVAQFVHLFIGEIFRPFEQAPTAFGQHRLFSFGLEFPGFLGPDLVDGFAHVAHNMEAVEDVDRVDGLLGNHTQIRFPHIAANKLQLFTSFRPEPVKKAPEYPGGPVGADPEQALFPGVQLINQGYELVFSALAPAYFIGTDCGNTVQITVGKSPFNGHFHRANHGVPTGHEGYRHFLPAHPLGPSGQKPGVGGGQPVLASGPRHFFHLDPAAVRAINPARTVEEKDRNPPQGDILEAPLGHGIVAGAFPAAARADRPAAAFGSQGDLQSQTAVPAQFASVVYKTWLFFDPVQDSLDLHPVSPCSGPFRGGNFSRQGKTGCFFCEAEVGGAVAWRTGTVKAKPPGGGALRAALTVPALHA